jgi:UDP-glucose 4-epimerase
MFLFHLGIWDIGMKDKKIVITGGAGFIGSNLARFLTQAKNDVIVIDDLSTGRLENIKDIIDEKNFRFVKGSITDLDILRDSFSHVDYVFHQAALPSVPRSIKDPLTTNEVNIKGTLNVLVAAKDAGVRKVVYASSSSVYGDTPTLPKKETMTPNPLSPYAVSKIAGEYYCQIFADVFRLPTVSLRYFNVYGPWQDPSSEYAAVIPKFIGNVLKDKPPVVYGDGTQTRDFTFINDVVQANVRAMEATATGVFNAAGGKRITINDLAKTIMQLCQKEMDIVYEAARPGDIKHSLADSSKAKASFGYAPQYDITKGLKETLPWYQKQQ